MTNRLRAYGPASWPEYCLTNTPGPSAQAIATRSFWLILISSSLGMMCFMGILINFFAFATDTDAGFTTNQASIAFATFSGFSLIGKLPWAYLSDRIDIRISTVFTYTVSAFGIALLINADAFWMLLLWGIVFGTGISGIAPLPALAWGSYYGRTFLGSIRGVTSSHRFPGPGLGAPSLRPSCTTIWRVTKPPSPFSSACSFSQAASCSSPEKPVPPSPLPKPESQRLFPQEVARELVG